MQLKIVWEEILKRFSFIDIVGELQFHLRLRRHADADTRLRVPRSADVWSGRSEGKYKGSAVSDVEGGFAQDGARGGPGLRLTFPRHPAGEAGAVGNRKPQLRSAGSWASIRS
ncbi:MAG: hypothetical protein ACYC8V_05885 [Caulobacteraceae bacterium]